MNESQIQEIFNDIILGKGVKQSVHYLVHENRDFTRLFIQCLNKHSFYPLPIKEISLEVGFRMPGFYLENQTAIFGHLFWEVFSEKRKRKIWGSIVRNHKGDWKYILTGNSPKVIYFNMSKIQEIDIFHLTWKSFSVCAFHRIFLSLIFVFGPQLIQDKGQPEQLFLWSIQLEHDPDPYIHV